MDAPDPQILDLAGNRILLIGSNRKCIVKFPNGFRNYLINSKYISSVFCNENTYIIYSTLRNLQLALLDSFVVNTER